MGGRTTGPPAGQLLRAAFDQTGITPRQLWTDRVLDEARHSIDPVHLVRLFGIHPNTAVRPCRASAEDSGRQLGWVTPIPAPGDVWRTGSGVIASRKVRPCVRS
ncbi:hypothetical protein C4B68_00340 [Streptomyces dengpaensis]|uniref:Uncharacterized protein n=1 Tax=Streptomyces dengpaensis TaxID=2049881 RepID=A0ABM6SJX1_9ACTN|nr:hypothetical protein C4B68_00340 [Streptomyces dengpaensis]